MNTRDGVRIEALPMRAPIAPTRMDAALKAHIETAAERHAHGKWQGMPSGAFHDAGIVSARSRLRCFHPLARRHQSRLREDSREEDIVLGCQVLADAAASILPTAVTVHPTDVDLLQWQSPPRRPQRRTHDNMRVLLPSRKRHSQAVCF